MPRENVRTPEKALSARFVETVTEPGKYFDGQGLFLRVAKNGARQWVQRIVIRGKRTELGLGSPPAVSLATARKLALENRGKAMLGGDPLAEKRAAKAKPLTFVECVNAYAEAKLSEFRSDKHRRQWFSSLERLAFPVLGQMQAQAIGTKDVLRMLEPHWRERTATAKKLRGQVEAVLTWATVAGHREGDNPAAWRGKLKELLPAPGKVAKAQHHPALDLHDVAGWWADLAKRDGMAAKALQFLALTGARSGEVRGMTLDEIENRERAAEEARGLIRWLRPEYQNPTGTQAQTKGDQAAMALGPVDATDKPPFPKALPDQIAAVRAALSDLGEVTPEQVARSFKRGRAATVQPLLESLTALGQARLVDGGRFAV